MPYRSPLDETAAIGMGIERRFEYEQAGLEQGKEIAS